MRRLSSQRAIEAWERGQTSDSQELPLALLSVALPDADREHLARLPVGRRDALLMRLRERTFGRRMAGFAQCPQCAARLQFQLDLATYDTAEALERPLAVEDLAVGAWHLRFRSPDSRDLAHASRCPDEASARMALLERCLLEARRDGEPVAVTELPEEVVTALGARMEELDPLSYLPLAIDCANCGHEWVVLFDVAALFWEEIASAAERLLHEVRTLALTYGWSESEILAMSEARRRFYLRSAGEAGSEVAASAARSPANRTPSPGQAPAPRRA